MKNKLGTWGLILCLFMLVAASGYNYFARPFAPVQMPTPEPTSLPELVVKSADQQIFESLDSQQRIAQLMLFPLDLSAKRSVTSTASAIMAPTSVSNTSPELDLILRYQPGGVILFGERVSTSSAQESIQAAKDQMLSLPLWVAVDHEGGSVQRLSGAGFTRLPSWSSICQQPLEDIESLIASSAGELQAVGVSMVLGPMVDAGTSSVLGSRLCDDDWQTVAERSSGAVRAYSAAGILSVIKHFPGIGSTRKDLHTAFDTIVAGEEAQIYKQLLENTPQPAVMVSHAGIENQFPDVPCSQSPACVGELFSAFPDVLLLSDSLDMKSAYHTEPGLPEKTLLDVTYNTVMAGVDVLIFGRGNSPADLDQLMSSLLQKYKDDADFRARVDQSAQKIIRYKLGVIQTKESTYETSNP